MDLFSPSGTELLWASFLFAAGLLLGIFAARAGSRARARIRELEDALRQEQEEHAAYRGGVAKHFDRTSDLFRDLTHQYTVLYAHLAEGARDLCGDLLPAAGSRFGAPVLTPGQQPQDDAPSHRPPDEEPREGEQQPPDVGSLASEPSSTGSATRDELAG